MQDIFNATILTGAAGPGPHSSALLTSTLPIQGPPCNAADQVDPPPPVCTPHLGPQDRFHPSSTPRLPVWQQNRRRSRRPHHTLPQFQPPDLSLSNRYEALAPPNSTTSTLVIGSSMVRDVNLSPLFGNSEVHCFPGARVLDLDRKIPDILASYSAVDNIIVHVGTNDIKAQGHGKVVQAFRPSLLARRPL
ncbi:hypothetical protein SKAU_G00424330 [Synaphobranchus kaupii]|uniref:SGNH hydrolase-type esterase domain-containing protein n=1 Tax=Synaphobranchus kaupii TaxID=118154 RepID=A0A9Q1E5K3_SYNKA|nr:hypothetical protein SKAU_G00424330 [Synaphobranchus kaupii]